MAKKPGTLSPSTRNFDALPNSARVGIDTVELIYGASRATIFRRLRNDPKFPKPTKTPSGVNRWTVGDLRSHLSTAA